MGPLNVIGWVSSDLIEGSGAGQSPYLGFSLAERVGYGASVRTQFDQVQVWGDLMRQLKKAIGIYFPMALKWYLIFLRTFRNFYTHG